MIEKLLKIAAVIDQEKVQYLNDALEHLRGTDFEEDLVYDQRNIIEDAENLMPKLASKLEMSLTEMDMFFDRELASLEKRAQIAEKALPLLERGTLGGWAARAGLGIAGTALTGVAASVMNDLYNNAKLTVTEKSNFESMLKHNPDLHEMPKDKVLSIFKTVHRLGGTDLSGDPNVAGTIVRNNVMLGDYNKGIDMKGLSDLVNTRSNLSRGTQVIAPHNGEFPGLDIHKSVIEARKSDHEKNKHQLALDQYNHRKDRDKIEDKNYAQEREDKDIMNRASLFREQREQEAHSDKRELHGLHKEEAEYKRDDAYNKLHGFGRYARQHDAQAPVFGGGDARRDGRGGRGRRGRRDFDED